MKPEIIITLKNLGFTEYEAKAYLALLEKSPLSGYGVALNSGVPRSKIYEVLDGMAQNGEVIISYGAPVLYAPLPPKELIDQRRNKTEENFNAAYNSLEDFSSRVEDRDNIWNISGYDEIINKVREIINNANESLLLEIWKEDLDKINHELAKAIKRKIKISIASREDVKLENAEVYKISVNNEEINDALGRSISICADDKEALTGVVSMGNESLAATSKNVGLTIPVSQIIKRSIFIAKSLSKQTS